MFENLFANAKKREVKSERFGGLFKSSIKNGEKPFSVLGLGPVATSPKEETLGIIAPKETKSTTEAILEQPKETELGFAGPLKFIETTGQSIARSLLATAVAIPGVGLNVPNLKATYTPTGNVEKKIFGNR